MKEVPKKAAKSVAVKTEQAVEAAPKKAKSEAVKTEKKKKAPEQKPKKKAAKKKKTQKKQREVKMTRKCFTSRAYHKVLREQSKVMSHERAKILAREAHQKAGEQWDQEHKKP